MDGAPVGKLLEYLGTHRTGVLRLHSRLRGLVKRTWRILNHGRSLRFQAALINSGDLVFDVGANVGEMTALYLELGARVVSVEPQEQCLSVLQRRFGNHPRVTIIPMAVGATEGAQEIMLSDIRSPLSSMSEKWIAAVKSSGRFPYYEWSRAVTVPVTTLDSLIAAHGEPAFCKIDVEGFESEVLKGLSRPVGSLSFEYHVEFPGPVIECVERLEKLGSYRFNYTVEKQTRWELSSWVDGRQICDRLQSLPFSSLQGDVYCRLMGSYSATR